MARNQGSSLAMPSFSFAIVLLLSLSSSCTEQDRSSLLRFLAGLSQDGGLAASWRNGTDCCTWEGITCNAKREVTEVSLASRGLDGEISPSLGTLDGMLRLNLSSNTLYGILPLEVVYSSSLLSLDVSFNHLTGPLQGMPSSISRWPLEVLNISSNFLTGSFPSNTWEKARNLVALNASNNSFTGWMPSSFCISAPSFAVLDLCYNQLNGHIPPELGKCSALRVLKAGNNNMVGALPEELFDATTLEHLSLPNNLLEGTTLDAGSINKLRNLIVLDLAATGLSGKIPDSIGQLKRLEELHLGQNNMSGELPAALSKCTNLTTIILRNNNFHGEIAKVNFSALSNLKTLDLCTNNFTGTIPESIYSCVKLTALELSLNKFHGQLSNRVRNLKSLSFLSLTDNNFTNITNTLHILKSSRNLMVLLIGLNFRHEVMPQDGIMDGFENLQVLGIDKCSLSGNLPVWLSKLTNLKILFLSNNRLTGPIPSWINTLHSLFYIDIANNNLGGEIPAELMEMPMLKVHRIAYFGTEFFEIPIYVSSAYQYRTLSAFPQLLNLSSNNLAGVIPPDIGQLGGLVALDLSFNNLYGGIPQSIGNLTTLLVLDLSSNHLTGTIPPVLMHLHFLSKFNVSNNDLEGPIPNGGQFDTFPKSSFDGNPKLYVPTVTHYSGPAEASPVSILLAKQVTVKIIFLVAFISFFIVGVLYDQVVLSRYLSYPYS